MSSSIHPFVHLHVRSGYSLLRGVNLVEEIVLSARERGYKALALTDINNLYACVRFWDLAKQAGLHPILGSEIFHASGRAVLLVESKKGYARLCEILSAVHQEADFDLITALREEAGGLVILSKDPRLLEGLRDAVPLSHLFGLVHPPCSPTWLRCLESKGIPPVASTEATFLDPSEYSIHKILRAIDLNTSLSRTPEVEIVPPTAWFMPPDEIRRVFRAIPEAVENSVKIAERCILDSPPWGETVFPSYEGLSPEQAQAELERMCWEAIDGRYGGRPPDVVARLRRELEIIREKGFASYFLVVRDIVKKATQGPHNDSVRRPWSGAEGASRICGRGSGAASLVSHLLGITAVDPIRHNLLFERFLNPSRKDPPDIDVDFAWDERDDILSYVFEKYGLEHTAMVANHVTFQPRMAVREVAKVYGLPDDEIGVVTERIGGYFESSDKPSAAVRGNAFRRPEADHGRPAPAAHFGGRTPPQLSGGCRDLDLKDPWPEILKRADRIVGLPRHLSVHPGGVVLTPGPIDRHVPIQTARKELPSDGNGSRKLQLASHREGVHRVLHPPGSRTLQGASPCREESRRVRRQEGGAEMTESILPAPPYPERHGWQRRVPIIHWEKDQAEDAGLVKIDLLGNRSLAVIRDAIRMAKENGCTEIDFLRTNPIDDPGAQELMRTGRTMGCFYVESPAMRLLLKRCRKPDYDHLVIASSIIRPAANDYIMEYVARVRGEKPAVPIHPLLEPVLSDSYQIAVYQEHVMLISMAFAGFSIAEADGLRKALGKKDYFVRLGQFRDKFFNGARAKGVTEEKIHEVWRMIESFSGYSFCKPHSASYAMVSYQSAFIKAHHPAEFYAAVISNQGGYYHWWAYHNDAIREGLRVLPPSINLSDWKWRAHGRPAPGDAGRPMDGRPGTEGEGYKGTLRMGLMQIKGLKTEAAEAVMEDRKRGGPYGSLREFIDRVDIDPSQIVLLIKAGCWDNVSVNLTRPQLIWYVLRDAKTLSPHRSSSPKRSGGEERGNRTIPPSPPFHKGGWGGIYETTSSLFDAPTRLPCQDGERYPERQGGPRRVPALGAYDEETTLRHETEVLGFLVSRHPLTLYKRELDRVRPIQAKDLDRYGGKEVTLVGWWVTSKPAETKHGERMEFVSFEDTTALFDATLFPDVFARAVPYLHRKVPYVMRGKVEQQCGACTVTVSSIAPLRPIRSGASRQSGSRRGSQDAFPEENRSFVG